jgi:hypothetical protein
MQDAKKHQFLAKYPYWGFGKSTSVASIIDCLTSIYFFMHIEDVNKFNYIPKLYNNNGGYKKVLKIHIAWLTPNTLPTMIQSGLIYNLMTPRRLIGFLASSVVFALGYVINNQQLCHIDWLIDWIVGSLTPLSAIMATSFSGGGRRSTRREPPTLGKQLVNFITCGCESSAAFFIIYKAGRKSTPYWW